MHKVEIQQMHSISNFFLSFLPSLFGSMVFFMWTLVDGIPLDAVDFITKLGGSVGVGGLLFYGLWHYMKKDDENRTRIEQMHKERLEQTRLQSEQIIELLRDKGK